MIKRAINALQMIPTGVRAYVYRVATVAVPLAVTYGVVSEQKAALWLALAGAVLTSGMAAANTPRDYRG